MLNQARRNAILSKTIIPFTLSLSKCGPGLFVDSLILPVQEAHDDQFAYFR